MKAMTAAEREFFKEVSRMYTGAAAMATALACDCQSSGHGQVASPAEVEASLWPYLDGLHELGAGLRARRDAIREPVPVTPSET